MQKHCQRIMHSSRFSICGNSIYLKLQNTLQSSPSEDLGFSCGRLVRRPVLRLKRGSHGVRLRPPNDVQATSHLKLPGRTRPEKEGCAPQLQRSLAPRRRQAGSMKVRISRLRVIQASVFRLIPIRVVPSSSGLETLHRQSGDPLFPEGVVP